jgi:hypothetical protein
MAMVVSRFKVYLAHLDPTEDYKIRKARLGLVISHDERKTR